MEVTLRGGREEAKRAEEDGLRGGTKENIVHVVLLIERTNR